MEIKGIKVRKYILKEIPLHNIIPSIVEDVNVRRLSTVKKEDLDILKSSIAKQGLFVPLIVKPDSNQKDLYIIVDGQRRYLALKDLKKKGYEIPNIPCLVGNLSQIEAFQLSYEESRTQVKVTSKNLEHKAMEELENIKEELEKQRKAI